MGVLAQSFFEISPKSNLMETLLWVLVLLISFSTMEFMAWFSHKYIMHALGTSQRSPQKNHKSWFERNDLFLFFMLL